MSTRNNHIDALKVLLAFLVVALHIFPVSKLEGIPALISYEIVNGITRVAVPLFFIISGYLLQNKLNDKSYLWIYSKRILLLFVVWQLIYVPDLIRCYHLKWFSLSQLFLKLVYGYWHLWYLLATVLALGLLYVTRNFSLKTKWFLIVFLFLFGFVFQFLVQSNFVNNPILLKTYALIGTTRNFLFLAFPMMLLGSLYNSWKMYANKWRFLLIPLLLLLLLETYLYYTLKVKAMDFLLILIPFCLILFYSVETRTSKPFEFPSNISLGIYLCHPYAIRLVYEFLPKKTFELIVLKYFLVCIVALLFWYILDKINRKYPYFL